MAYIDKTYLTSKEQYHQIVEWCKDKVVWDKPIKTRFWETAKPKIYVSDFIYKYTDEELDEMIANNGEIVLWNTPTYFDVWLIRNCPFDFIQDRLKEQYGNEWTKTSLTNYQEASKYDLIKNYKSVYDDYKRNGLGKKVHYKKPKIHIIRGTYAHKIYISIEDNNFSYDDANDCWNHELELKPQYNYGDFYCYRDFNWKWFTRKLQKWDLPKNITLKIYIFSVTKEDVIEQEFKIITK